MKGRTVLRLVNIVLPWDCMLLGFFTQLYRVSSFSSSIVYFAGSANSIQYSKVIVLIRMDCKCAIIWGIYLYRNTFIVYTLYISQLYTVMVSRDIEIGKALK